MIEVPIVRFRGDYGFLSNFAEIPITYEGLTYKCLDSAFIAQMFSEV